MAKKDRHVIPKAGGGWAIKRSGAERVSQVFDSQEKAINHARNLARREGGELYVHGRDGTIKQRDSYGSPQLPPKKKR